MYSNFCRQLFLPRRFHFAFPVFRFIICLLIIIVKRVYFKAQEYVLLYVFTF